MEKLSESHKGIKPPSRKGVLHTEETKNKMREAHRNRILWNKGKYYSEDLKRKLSEAQKKVWSDPKHKKKMSEAHKGKPSPMKGKKIGKPAWNRGISPSPEIRKKMSKAKKGKPSWNKGKTGIYSHEQIQRMRDSHKGQVAWNKGLSKGTDERVRKYALSISGENNRNYGKTSWNKGKKMGKPSWMKGKTHTEEARRKISLAGKGRKLSEEHKKRLIESLIGRKVSEETKRKIREANRGKEVSKETRKKIGLAGKGRPAWNRGISPSEEVKMKRMITIKNKWSSNPELKERQSQISRATLLRLYESGNFPKQTNTMPERKIKAELIKRGYQEEINFIHQYKFMNKFMCDFVFPRQKIVVEVDGDFWHSNPKKYPDQTKLHPHQIKGMGKDKAKNAYIMKADGGSWTLLRFWESEIYDNVAKCVDRIEKVLRNKAIA